MGDWVFATFKPAAIAVLLGLLFLHMFFRAVESRWPASYFALVSGPDYAISRNLLRYLVFRLGPVFATGVFVAVTLERVGVPPLTSVVLMGIVHAGATSGRAFIADAKSKRRRQRMLRLVVHPAVVMAVVATSVASVWCAPFFANLVPGLDRISSDLLVGLVAGVVAAYAIRVSTGSHLDVDEVLKASRRTIPDDIWDAVPDLAAAADADPTLIRAVMLVENVQRPRWLRKLERLGARAIGKPATLGLLQTLGSPRETDRELLERAIESRFQGRHLPASSVADAASWAELERFLMRYNPDRRFVDAALEALAFLQR